MIIITQKQIGTEYFDIVGSTSIKRGFVYALHSNRYSTIII